MEVLVIGRNCLDHIAVVARFPEENKKMPLQHRLTEGGGQGGTTSACIARLGGRVALVGKLGDDDAGRFCLKRLADFDVDTGDIEIIQGESTPQAYIFVTAGTGSRTIVYEKSRLPKIALNQRLHTLIRQARVVLLDPEVTYLAPVIGSRIPDAPPIVYDAERWREGMAETMASVDYFVPSADFFDAEELNLPGASFEHRIMALKEIVPKTLVVTRGSHGAYFVEDGHLHHVAPPGVRVVDTLGAGDNFHGAFALAVARGFPLARAVRLAVAVGSLSCRAYGGRQAIPDYDTAMAVARGLTCRRICLS